jgi:hypothetical protein
VGSLQVLGWLFFCPSAWRYHVARIDPTLPPDFCLLDVRGMQWRHPIFQRLLVQGCVIWPGLVGGLVGLGLWLTGMSGHSIVRGMTFGAMVGAATSAAGGTFMAVGSGMVAGVLGGIMGGVARGLAGEVVYTMALSEVAGAMASGIASVALSVTVGISHQRVAVPFARQLASILIGLLIAGVVASAVLVIVRSGVHGVTASMATSGVVGSTLGLAAWLRSRRWHCSTICGVVAAMLMGVAHHTVTDATVPGTAGMLASGMVSVVCSGVFLLPYVLAGRMAGPWARSVAGAVGGGSWLTFVLVDTKWFPVFAHGNAWRLLPYMLLGVLIGLTQSLWRPVLCYPLQAAWGLILYRAEERRARARPSLLGWHAAFWDEGQRLPLPFLDEHLVLVAERHPTEFRDALMYIMTSTQRWAAQAAQIELDVRLLRRCTDVDAIRTVCRHLTASTLDGPASAVLRSLSRISQDVDAALRQSSAYNQRLALSTVEEHLDGLLRELTRSGARDVVRFLPVVTAWRHIVAAYTHHLVAEVERRQEIDSPYVLSVPLTPQQDLFVGRTDIGARLEQLLRGHRRPPLLLYGQRRMGKTSLLNHLGRLLPSTIVPLFVDLQGPAARASDHVGLLYNIARGMVASAMQQRELALPMLSREACATDPFTRFDEWLDEVEQMLEHHTVLLALDEFEALDSAMSTGRFREDAVLGMLRHLIQHRSRFTVLLAGSHTLYELQRWASYLINVQTVHIDYLHASEARQLIEHPVPDFALRYEPEACQRVIELTRCHPALVQLLAAEIVALKNEQPSAVRRLARFADVETAVPRALLHGSMFFVDIQRNQVDATGRALLHVLATHGAQTVVPRAVLAETFPQELDQTLAQLIRRELVEAVEGGYRFQVELTRRWFAQAPGRVEA